MDSRVLIVEDNWVESLTLGVFLEDNGIKVTAKLDNAESVPNEINSADLVLLDINLSGEKTGLDVAEELRLEGLQTPIIFLSAMSDKLTKDRISKIPNCQHILKPYDYDTLHNEIIKMIG